MRTRYEIVIDYPVRARRGEARGPKGCLRQAIVGYAPSLAEARTETAQTIAALDYGTHVETRYYDATAFLADPLRAKPLGVDSAIAFGG